MQLPLNLPREILDHPCMDRRSFLIKRNVTIQQNKVLSRFFFPGQPQELVDVHLPRFQLTRDFPPVTPSRPVEFCITRFKDTLLKILVRKRISSFPGLLG
jgi:hypothetical protein